MVFSGLTFIFYFLPLFFLFYAILPKSQKNTGLLVGSIVFYAWGAPTFVFVLLASTIIDYYIVKKLYQAPINQKKKWLTLSISLNLGLLIYFKYTNFLIENVNILLTKWSIGSMTIAEIALPIGISFYTFQTLTYSIDIYRGQNKPLESVRDYVLYIMMFPQLIAGPIVRYSHISEQIRSRTFGSKQFVEGFIRFTVGLAKKVLIANTLASVADIIFGLSVTELTGTLAWLGIILYTFQIYFDFAGYSDMAIGLGKMLGFKFPENFDSPYTSISITEFWRKWHITLGGFMRDYLYLPLGGNKKGTLFTYRNLVIVFFLSGLWHGASWNFVLWGLFHGLFLVLERITGLAKSNRFRLPRTLLTFILVVFGWVLFRVENTESIGYFYNALFQFNGEMPIYLYRKKLVVTLLFAFVFAFITSTKTGKKWQQHFYSQSYTQKALICYFGISIVLFILSVASLSTGSFNPFIYFRF